MSATIPTDFELDESFPQGSLLPYLTPEYEKDQLAIVAGCVWGPSDLE